MLRFQPGVEIAYWNPRLNDIFTYASAWGALRGLRVDVNSIDDKTHGAGTLHGWSLAVDLDTEGDRHDDLGRLFGFLARYLPDEYDVVLEKDHVHVECDLGRRPPPSVAPAPVPAIGTA